MIAAVELRRDPTQCNFQPLLHRTRRRSARPGSNRRDSTRRLRGRAWRLDADEPGRLRRLARPQLGAGHDAARRACGHGGVRRRSRSRATATAARATSRACMLLESPSIRISARAGHAELQPDVRPLRRDGVRLGRRQRQDQHQRRPVQRRPGVRVPVQPVQRDAPDRGSRATRTRSPASPASAAPTAARSGRWGESQIDLDGPRRQAPATGSGCGSTSVRTAAPASTAGTSTTSRSRPAGRRASPNQRLDLAAHVAVESTKRAPANPAPFLYVRTGSRPGRVALPRDRLLRDDAPARPPGRRPSPRCPRRPRLARART